MRRRAAAGVDFLLALLRTFRVDAFDNLHDEEPLEAEPEEWLGVPEGAD